MATQTQGTNGTNTAQEKDFSATYHPLPEALKDLPVITDPEWPDKEHLPPEEAEKMTPKELTSSRLKHLDTVEKMDDPGPAFWGKKPENMQTRSNFIDILEYIHHRRNLIGRVNELPLREAREEAAKITLQGIADAGIKLNIYGKTAQELGYQRSITTANHVGWMDGIILFALTKLPTAGKQTSFLAAKLLSWAGLPLGIWGLFFGKGRGKLTGYKGFGDIVKAANIAFKEVRQRGPAKGLSGYEAMIKIANEAVWNDDGLLYFGERTTTHGDRVGIGPSSTILRAAFHDCNAKNPTQVRKGAVVQPVVIAVHKARGKTVKVGERDSAHDDFAWYGGNARKDIVHTCGKGLEAKKEGGVELNITFLKPIDPAELQKQGVEVTPRSLANIAFAQIDEVLKMEPDEIMKHEIAAKAAMIRQNQVVITRP